MSWLINKISSVVDTALDRPTEEYCLNGQTTEQDEGDAYESTVADPVEVSRSLNRMTLKLYGQFLSEDGTEVDYDALATSDLYKELQREVRSLVRLDVTSLPADHAKVFWLNLYNVLEIHSTVACTCDSSSSDSSSISGNNNNNNPSASPSSSSDTDGSSQIPPRSRCKQRSCYNVGGLLYTLGDVEHGVLRCNSRPPYSPWRRFRSSDDGRLKSVLQLDCRIHFSLNCGARSCPPIRLYTPENVERALDLAATSFVTNPNNVRLIESVEQEQSTLYLSQIFRWYSADFGVPATDFKNTASVTFIASYLEKSTSPDSKKLAHRLHELVQSRDYICKWIPYDWGRNSKK